MLPIGLIVAESLIGQPASDLAAEEDSYIKAAGIQGSVLMAKKGQVILARGYGLADIELDVSNKSETKFRLGSKRTR